MMGMTYARVFPDPVFARATISRPFRARGMAAACTKVGFSNCFDMALRRRESSPNDANDGVSSTEVFFSGPFFSGPFSSSLLSLLFLVPFFIASRNFLRWRWEGKNLLALLGIGI